MDQQIIRNCVMAERLERGMATYQALRSRGVQLPDPLAPSERQSMHSQYIQRLESARLFMRSLMPTRVSG